MTVRRFNAGPARIWVTRAEPGAGRTAARLRDMGLDPVVTPLLEIEPLKPVLPDLNAFNALAFTSINGVAAFCTLTARRDHPVFTVGDATAGAARDAGFADVRSASGDIHALARLIAAEMGDAAVLAPRAETPAAELQAALELSGARGVSAHPLIVYRARPTGAPAPTSISAVLIHSPRAAHILKTLAAPRFEALVVACISPAAAAPLIAAGLHPCVAKTPDEAALLTILKAALGKRDPAV